MNKPKKPKNSEVQYRKYQSRPYYIRPSYVSYAPRPIQPIQTYQYPLNDYQYPYYSFSNPCQTSSTDSSYYSYPYNYYNNQYLEPDYPIDDMVYSEDDYSDEDESFLSKFAGLFKNKKKKKRKHSYY